MSFFDKVKGHFVPSRDNAYRPGILGRGSLMLLLAVVLLSEGVLVANLIARQSGHDFLAAVIQSEIIALTNTERVANSVGTLQENTQLDAAARAKAADMAAKGYFAHVSPNGTEPWRWIEQAGYNYQYAGENLAVRFVDSQDVLEAWMASPTHRANIVKGVYREIGVGVAEGMYEGQPATYVVQYFASPTAVLAKEVSSSVAANPAAVVATSSAATTSVAAVAPVPPAPTKVLAAETALTPSFSNSLAKQLGRLLSEPRATTAWVLGAVAALLIFALALAFFYHIQVQAKDMLIPGTLVAIVALGLVVINTHMLSGTVADTQAAAVVYSQP